jgi:hypothetical protein
MGEELLHVISGHVRPKVSVEFVLVVTNPYHLLLLATSIALSALLVWESRSTLRIYLYIFNW